MEIQPTYQEVLKVIITSNDINTRLEAVRKLQHFNCLDRRQTMDTLISLVRNQEIELCREFIALIIRPNLSSFKNINVNDSKDALLKASVDYMIAVIKEYPNEDKLFSEKPLFIEHSKEMLGILNDIFLISPQKTMGFLETLFSLSKLKNEELMEVYISYIINHPDYEEQTRINNKNIINDQDIIEDDDKLLYAFNKVKAKELADKIDNQLPNTRLKEKKVRI